METQDAFAAKYPTAQKVEWEMEAANEYEAEFKLDGKEMSANFAADGTWLETEMEIKKRDLPQVIKDAIAVQFPGYEIEEAEQVETPDLALGYEVELENEDTDEELEAVFTADGTLLKKKVETDDKITGLEIGSDDYLPKPFHLSELNARIKALVRRKNFGGNTTIDFQEIKIFPAEKRVMINENELTLTRSEYDLLVYFIANRNRVLSKESIAEHFVGDSADEMNNFDFIYSHVKNLRKKLLQSGAGDYIKAAYGVGYKFTDR